MENSKKAQNAILQEVEKIISSPRDYNYNRLVKLIPQLTPESIDSPVPGTTTSAPLLKYAIFANLVEVAKLLIENGANVNFLSGNTMISPLEFAIERDKSIEMIKMLLEKGADPNLGRRAPIWVAVTDRNENTYAIVTLLLDAGADVNQRMGIVKSSILGCTIRYSQLELYKLLISRGAVVHNWMIFELQASANGVEICKDLAPRIADINETAWDKKHFIEDFIIRTQLISGHQKPIEYVKAILDVMTE